MRMKCLNMLARLQYQSGMVDCQMPSVFVPQDIARPFPADLQEIGWTRSRLLHHFRPRSPEVHTGRSMWRRGSMSPGLPGWPIGISDHTHLVGAEDVRAEGVPPWCSFLSCLLVELTQSYDHSWLTMIF